MFHPYSNNCYVVIPKKKNTERKSRLVLTNSMSYMTRIADRPMELVGILAILSVSTFITDVILYSLIIN
jgi:hypothetical protein